MFYCIVRHAERPGEICGSAQSRPDLQDTELIVSSGQLTQAPGLVQGLDGAEAGDPSVRRQEAEFAWVRVWGIRDRRGERSLDVVEDAIGIARFAINSSERYPGVVSG